MTAGTRHARRASHATRSPNTFSTTSTYDRTIKGRAHHIGVRPSRIDRIRDLGIIIAHHTEHLGLRSLLLLLERALALQKLPELILVPGGIHIVLGSVELLPNFCGRLRNDGADGTRGLVIR